MSLRTLRIAALVSFIASMAVLLGSGYLAKGYVPPIPAKVVDPNGTVLTSCEEILNGQDTYQRYGLMDFGSLWGHGTLRGMDFSATTLHNLGQWMRDYIVSPNNPSEDAYESAPAEVQAKADAEAVAQLKTNRYDPSSDTLKLTAAQAYAFEQNRKYWDKVFAEGEPRYGILPNTVKGADERQALADFFFWTAWAAGTRRPGSSFSYTNNWPPDPSVGNIPTPGALVWSIAAVMGLFLFLGVVVYIIHRWEFFYGEARAAEAARRLIEHPVTPSQRAAAKFFLVAGLLFVAQILNGGLLAHYTVHPGSFYVEFIAKIYPYN